MKNNRESIVAKAVRLGINPTDLRILDAYGYTFFMNRCGNGLPGVFNDIEHLELAEYITAAHMLELYDEHLEGMLVEGISKSDVEALLSWPIDPTYREEITSK